MQVSKYNSKCHHFTNRHHTHKDNIQVPNLLPLQIKAEVLIIITIFGLYLGNSMYDYCVGYRSPVDW